SQEGSGDDDSKGASPSSTPADDKTPSEDEPSPTSDDSGSPSTVTVPYVLTLSEGQARRTLTGAQLRPAVTYEGSGDVECKVVSQDPPAGEKADPNSTVTVVVERAEESCPGDG
ncbi:MAG: PASTA domain-containing protein, partial [Stackebrandtia sp.]